MIEIIILDYLIAAGIDARMEISADGGPPPFVIIQRTGGGEENKIRRATVALQSYGASMYEAASLNERVVALMDGLAALPEIGACRLNSDYNYTDTAKKQYRYQAVFDVVYYSDQED
jgi:hypothetical protein